jgi:oxygen-independent coproporphyrinogen-3 oxidase
VSAIGRIGAAYYQNAKTLPEYHDALDQRTLPVVRGIALGRDDLLRRAVIMALMCQGASSSSRSSWRTWSTCGRYFRHELEQLEPLVEAGLVVVEPRAIQVTASGWYVVRAVAMVFDRYLQNDRLRERYSRVI